MRFIYTGLALFIAGVTAQNAPAGKVWGYNDFDYKGVKTTYDTPTTCENLQKYAFVRTPSPLPSRPTPSARSTPKYRARERRSISLATWLSCTRSRSASSARSIKLRDSLMLDPVDIS
ncbi:hypothetical protein ASPZODRAFT_139719 [Penicilliopsis zonata CBS 506.65]|uniref:Uncharacterized protein n=1 Tax=Penicilliopsis zonata CBS 506.65 TaxID=1073090 RepID=A0A1L9ST87_9EURO|nr:hypothetical protein ASPZODRAFT_139719 [Penicilliopsis zonata CBS 506.65]OJJ50422.1 hypothetical protein ASPZODRAFT_139719 [Penicilliopsis zonata CBS 506.65]